MAKSRRKRPSKEEIVAAIKKMTMAEVAELVKALKEEIEKTEGVENGSTKHINNPIKENGKSNLN